MGLAAADRAAAPLAQPSFAGALAVWVAVVFPSGRDGDREPLGDLTPRQALSAQGRDAGRGLLPSASEGVLRAVASYEERIYRRLDMLV